jgi:tetratricopeptide (TPR) repeat protein
MAAVPFLETPPAELRKLRSRLATWDAASVPASEIASIWFTAHDDVHEHLRVYLLGLLSANLNEPNAARASASALEKLDGSPEASTLAQNLARGVEAEVARRAGRAPEALAALQAMDEVIPYILQLSSTFHVGGRERFLRAELLEEAGRSDEALVWYGSFEEHSVYDLVYLGPSLLRRGEILERAGKTREAAGAYRRVVELWRECEPALAPLRDRARAALARLESSGGAASPPPAASTVG